MEDLIKEKYELFRNRNDLVSVQKPTVERKGREVTECFFFNRTGQCFGRRCFWTQNGECPFWEEEVKEN